MTHPADIRTAGDHLLIPPTQELITACWLADQLGIDGEDAGRLIKPARQRLEHDARISLLLQTWQLTLPGPSWPDPIILRHPPIKEVQGIEYVAKDGSSGLLDDSLYRLEYRFPGYIWRAKDASWPSLASQSPAIIVTYQTGHETAEAAEEAYPNARMAIREAARMILDGCQENDTYLNLMHLCSWGAYP